MNKKTFRILIALAGSAATSYAITNYYIKPANEIAEAIIYVIMFGIIFLVSRNLLIAKLEMNDKEKENKN